MAYKFLSQTDTESKITALGSFFSYPLTINCWFYPTLDGYGGMNLVELAENTAAVVHLLRINSGINTSTRTITTPDRVCIGFSRTSGSDNIANYEGYLAEVAIWNVTLTTDELSSLYTGTKANQIRPQNLKFYMPLVRNIYDATNSTTSITSGFTANPEVNHVRRYG